MRLDCTFPRNPKLLALLAEKDGHRAALVYLCSLSYSGEQGSDGWIPCEALPFLHGRLADSALLVRYGFWVLTASGKAKSNADSDARVTEQNGYPQGGGWLIHDWSDKQESSDENKKRRIRAQAAAAARWDGVIPMTPAERQKRYRARHSDNASGNAT